MRFLALLATLLTIGTAAAAQDDWPALFDVTGVSEGDVLNIRAGPSADTRIIGALTAGAAGIEVIAPGPNRRWGRINAGEGTGWVSLSYLQRQPGQWENGSPGFTACFGTEPFWNLRRSGDTVEMRTPESTGDPVRIAWEGPASGRRNIWGLTAMSDTSELTGIVRAEACSDTMSDRSFGLSLTLIERKAATTRLLSGCCSLAP